MYLTQTQVDGSREVRINLFQQDNTFLLEIRTIRNAYIYRVHPLGEYLGPEVLHSVWVNVSSLFPFFYETDAELEQYVFNGLMEMSSEQQVYSLERMRERPLVAPLPEHKLPAKRKRR